MKSLKALVLSFVAGAFASLMATAYGQNGAVDLVSSTTVYNPSEPFVSSGAVAGYFHHSRKLDFLFGARYFGPDNYGTAQLATNNGNGAFSVSASTNCASTFNVSPTLATDLDGDGVSDVLCTYANSGAAGLQINFGDGDGGFSADLSYQVDSANSNVVEAVAADFDGDGRKDLAVVASSNRLIILLNKGSKVFQPVASYPLPSLSNSNIPIKLVAGDLNGDHKYDLVLITGGSSAKMTPFFSTGGGAFKQGSTVDLGAAISQQVVSAALGDLNKDGYADLAVATDGGVRLMLGSANESFRAGKPISSGPLGCLYDSYPAYPGRSCLVLADFNKDGKLDLAVTSAFAQLTSQNPNVVRVYFGDGTGGFGNPVQYSALGGATALIAGDVNGTGNIDLVTAQFTQAGLSVLQNDGTGRFHATPISYAPNANGIASGDFNRDGKPDVAVVNTLGCKAPCDGTVTVLTGSGSTYLNAGKKYAIGMHGAAIAAGDLNRDGVLDLVVTNATAGDNADISVLLGNKDGTFQAARNYTLGSLSNSIFLADMNKDGKLDLLEDGGVALGKGDGTFGALMAFPGGLGYGYHYTTPHLFTAGDFNQDGVPDVAFASATDDPNNCGAFVQILVGNGKGGFRTGQLFSQLGTPVTAISSGRLRAGKPLDVVYANEGYCGAGAFNYPSYVEELLGNGNGTFSTPRLVTGNYTSNIIATGPITVADFNGDGRMDVGVGDNGNGQFAVVPGNGDGTFQSQSVFTALNNGNAVAVADFDHNGLPDVLLPNVQGVARLYASPTPTVSTPPLVFTQTGTTQKVTVKNTTKTVVRIGAGTSSNAGFALAGTTCGNSLAVGASCTLSVSLNYQQGEYVPADYLTIVSNGDQIAMIPLYYNPPQ